LTPSLAGGYTERVKEKEANDGAPEVVFISPRLLEAEQARGMLEGCGFLARVIDGNVVSMLPYLSGWAGGIKVVVPAGQAADARAVLADAGLLGGGSGGKGWLTK
jgi:hypothetical protein